MEGGKVGDTALLFVALGNDAGMFAATAVSLAEQHLQSRAYYPVSLLLRVAASKVGCACRRSQKTREQLRNA
jgi:hypothetical protein